MPNSQFFVDFILFFALLLNCLSMNNTNNIFSLTCSLIIPYFAYFFSIYTCLFITNDIEQGFFYCHPSRCNISSKLIKTLLIHVVLKLTIVSGIQLNIQHLANGKRKNESNIQQIILTKAPKNAKANIRVIIKLCRMFSSAKVKSCFSWLKFPTL